MVRLHQELPPKQVLFEQLHKIHDRQKLLSRRAVIDIRLDVRPTPIGNDINLSCLDLGQHYSDLMVTSMSSSVGMANTGELTIASPYFIVKMAVWHAVYRNAMPFLFSLCHGALTRRSLSQSVSNNYRGRRTPSHHEDRMVPAKSPHSPL